MGEGKKSPPPPAAVLSQPFYLAHRLATLNIRSNPAPGRKFMEVPTADELVPPLLEFPNSNSLDAEFEYHRVVNRWLYVFQERGDKWTWAGEYWVDESGDYHPVDMKLAKGKERNKRPKPTKDALKRLSLPYKINGKQVFNGFFLSGTRLTLHTIQRLETEDPWPQLDAYDLDPDLYPHKPEYGPYYGGQGYIRVTDVLWYAISLNKVMQQLRDLAVGWFVPAKELDAATRDRTDRRNKKKLLAETIKGLLKGDPKDDLGLRNEFASHPIPTSTAGGEAVMRKWLDDYQATAQWWEQNVNAAARMLIGELESDRMALVVDSYLVLLKTDPVGFASDMPTLLQEYWACIDRMNESAPGSAWLSKIIGDKSHFIHQYVLPESHPTEIQFHAIRRSIMALLAMWAELAVPYIEKYGTASLKTLIQAVNTIVEEDLLSVTFRNVTLHNVHVKQVGLHYENELTIATIVRKEPTHWTKHVPEGKITPVLDHFFFFLEALDLQMSIKTLMEAKGSSETVWAAVEAFRSTMDASVAFSVLAKLEEQTIKKIAGIAAVLDAITAFHEAHSMMDRGDYSAAAGYSMVSVGSGLIAVGCAVSLLGAETTAAGVGVILDVVGAIMMAAGWIVSLFTKDSDLELFVAHSVWGDHYGRDSAKTSWSEGPFESWHESNKDGLTRQVQAMYNLLENFSITGVSRKVTIHLGRVDPGSKLHVKLETDHSDKEVTAELELNLAKGKIGWAHATNLIVPKVVFGERSVEMDWRLSEEPVLRDGHYVYGREMDCSVRLDYYGNGSHWVPRSGEWVEYHTLADLEVKAVSSLED